MAELVITVSGHRQVFQWLSLDNVIISPAFENMLFFLEDNVTYYSAPPSYRGELIPWYGDPTKYLGYLMGGSVPAEATTMTLRVKSDSYGTPKTYNSTYSTIPLLMVGLFDSDGNSGDGTPSVSYGTLVQLFGWHDWTEVTITLNHFPVDGGNLYLACAYIDYGVPTAFLPHITVGSAPASPVPEDKAYISDWVVPDTYIPLKVGFRPRYPTINAVFPPTISFGFNPVSGVEGKPCIINHPQLCDFSFLANAPHEQALAVLGRSRTTAHITTGTWTSSWVLTMPWTIDTAATALYEPYDQYPIFVCDSHPGLRMIYPTKWECSIVLATAGTIRFAMQRDITGIEIPVDTRVVSIELGTVDDDDVFTLIDTIYPADLHDWKICEYAMPAGTTRVQWVINWDPDYDQYAWAQYRLLISDVYARTGLSEGEGAAMSFSTHRPAYLWQLRPEDYPTVQTIYTCTLSGDGESPPLTDIEIPMSSFTAYVRNTDPSYLSIIAPFDADIIDGIGARLNGELTIQKGYKMIDGSFQMETIIVSNFDSFSTFEGSRNASISMTGYKVKTYTAQKNVTLSGVSYVTRQSNTKTRVRCDVDMFLCPNDIANYGSGTMTVGEMVIIVNPTQAYMEVVEA